MEPRPHERGNRSATAFRNRLAPLQWSHVLMNVETGRRLLRVADDDAASMEPRPHERGNSRSPGLVLMVNLCFNGATSS